MGAEEGRKLVTVGAAFLPTQRSWPIRILLEELCLSDMPSVVLDHLERGCMESKAFFAVIRVTCAQRQWTSAPLSAGRRGRPRAEGTLWQAYRLTPQQSGSVFRMAENVAARRFPKDSESFVLVTQNDGRRRRQEACDCGRSLPAHTAKLADSYTVGGALSL